MPCIFKKARAAVACGELLLQWSGWQLRLLLTAVGSGPEPLLLRRHICCVQGQKQVNAHNFNLNIEGRPVHPQEGEGCSGKRVNCCCSRLIVNS